MRGGKLIDMLEDQIKAYRDGDLAEYIKNNSSPGKASDTDLEKPDKK